MNNIKKKFLVFSVFLFSFLFLTQLVFASVASAGSLWDDQNKEKNMEEIGKIFGETNSSTGGPTVGAHAFIAKIIKIALGLLGIIFVVLLVISGFKYMTAGGNEEQIKESLGTIKHAVVGLIIVLLAYSITYYVFDNLPGGAESATETE
ncbi:MAG: pilin [Patescibacteria group bacterium]